MSITLTLKEYSEYTKQVSSFWMTGITELYDQLGNAALTLAQKEQAFAQFCYDRMQMGREWTEYLASQARTAGDTAKTAFYVTRHPVCARGESFFT